MHFSGFKVQCLMTFKVHLRLKIKLRIIFRQANKTTYKLDTRICRNMEAVYWTIQPFIFTSA